MNNSSNQQQKQIEKLIKQAYCPSLQKLDLCSKPNIWKNVLRHRKWKKLKQLHLTHCQITGFDVLMIVQMQQVETTLHLGRNYIKNIDLLLQAQWSNLTELCLQYNNIDANGLTQLPSARLNNLIFLTLNGNPIGNGGAKLLVKANLPLLASLSLEKCSLRDDGLKHLAKGKWPVLEQCYLNKNHVNFHGLYVLSNFSISKIRKISYYEDMSAWEVVYFIATDSPQIVQMAACDHNNQSIRKDVNAILKMKSLLRQLL